MVDYSGRCSGDNVSGGWCGAMLVVDGVGIR